MSSNTHKEHRLLSWTAAFLLLTPSVSAELIHRYSFNEDPGSATVTDSVTSQTGRLMQIAPGGVPQGSVPNLDGSRVNFDGIGGYVELPERLVSGLEDVTIEAWVLWGGGGSWQRIFDIGDIRIGTNPAEPGGLKDTDGTLRGAAPEGGDYLGNTYLFLTPNGDGSGRMRFAASTAWFSAGAERPILNDPLPFETLMEVHVAVTYGPGGARLFYQGEQVDAEYLPPETFIPLSAIDDVNVWLGRSLYPDTMFSGALNEFRIHNRLLTAQELAASNQAGPDNPSYDPGAATSLSLNVRDSMIPGEIQTVRINATFQNIGAVEITGADVTLTSGNTDVIVVDPAGRLRAVGAGSALITASLNGENGSSTITVSASAPELTNRYSFTESPGATEVVDSVGGRNGTVMPPLEGGNAITFSDGQAVFPGGAYQTAAYIHLPGGMVSSRTDVTIETWTTWNGPANSNWQRIFDFGSSGKGSDPHVAGNGITTFHLTPRRGTSPNNIRFNITGGPDLVGQAPLSVGQEAHVVIVYAPRLNLSRMYVNGIPVASGTAAIELSGATPFADPNCWLGVSQWNDPPLNGAIREFRIYEGGLSDLDVAISRTAGANTVVGDPGAFLGVTLEAPPLYIGNPNVTQAELLADFANIQDVNVAGVSGVSFLSADTNIFTVSATGSLLPVSLGEATLTGGYRDLNPATTVRVLAPTALRQTAVPTLIGGQAPVALELLADFGDNTDVNVLNFAGVTHSTSDASVASVNAAGQIFPSKTGTTTITSSYGGLQAQTTVTVESPPNFQPGELIHRYSFNEAPDTGTVSDSVGTAHGTVVNLAVGSDNNNFTGTGQLAMAGTGNSGAPTSAYVDLPNGLVSGLNAVTLEGWVTWRAEVQHARFFDFGSSNNGEGQAGTGQGYMFLSPWSGASRTRFAIKEGTGPETPNLVSSVIVTAGDTHFAVAYDPPNGVVRLYINGQRTGTAAATLPLSVVEDVNNWLGRAQWSGDAMLNGLYDEFRIYNGALLDHEVAASFTAGPENIGARPQLRVTAGDGAVIVTWPAAAEGFVLEASTALGAGASWSEVSATQMGDEMQASIAITGDARFLRLRK